MADYNIRDLLKPPDPPPLDPFKYPKWLCHSCCAIHYDYRFDCNVCGVEFVNEEEKKQHFPGNPPHTNWSVFEGFYGRWDVSNDYYVWVSEKLEDQKAHARSLAQIVQSHDNWRKGEYGGDEDFYPRDFDDVCSVATAVVKALSIARHFVHVMSWGNIGWQVMGMLATTAQRGVPVRVVSGHPPSRPKGNGNTPDWTAYEMEGKHNQYFGTHYRRVPGRQNFDQPHLKYIVVDGLLAFYGSTNATDFGLFGTLPEKRTNDFEIWTDLAKIQEKHNEFFSFWWKKTEVNREWTLGGWAKGDTTP